MTTRINITVDQSGLLEQVANQTRANHEALVIRQEQKKVEEVASKQLTEKRRSLNQDVKTGEPLAIATPGGSGYGNPGGFNRINQDPAATRRKSGSPGFIAVINVNSAKDDVFLLSIRVASGGDSGAVTTLTGNADFSPDNEKTAYLYVDQRVSNQEISNITSSQSGWTFRNIYRQSKLLLNTKLTYELVMTNIQNNNNGNYGLILYGVAGATPYEAYWAGDSGADIIVPLGWT